MNPENCRVEQQCDRNQAQQGISVPFHVYTLSMYQLNPANSLCEAMGGGKERVPPGCLSPGASLRVVGVFYRRMLRIK